MHRTAFRYLNDWEFESTDVNPFYGPSQKTLIECGAKDKDITGDKQYWRFAFEGLVSVSCFFSSCRCPGARLLSANFLHAGVVHLVINMMALWNLAEGGQNISRSVAGRRPGLSWHWLFLTQVRNKPTAIFKH